ncbi:glycosyltransferase [Motilimonas eburnea]|uniref:glycosyltransferase n=1 Tax=Motilimonas eburnea TaxID=1737488 RepID=UPI001E2E297E|nr:glycosyltransferase [Motilimonas eburnea]MCE2572589.1 glycosyltransferase [Motilimonas eburnea]
MSCRICIISPVHTQEDIRVFKKELSSLINTFSDGKFLLICRSGQSEQVFDNDVNLFLLNYSNRLSRFLFQPKIFIKALKFNADIYHIHNPDCLIIGLALKLSGKKVIYDTHENFKKKILLRDWIPKALRMVTASSVFYLEKLLTMVFDATIVTQKEQLSQYQRSFLVGNSPLYSNEYLAVSKQYRHSNVMKLVYIGGVSEDRGLTNMLELTKKLNKKIPTQLTLIGPTINSMTQDEIIERVSKYDNVSYNGSLPQSQAFNFAATCHFGLIMLDDVADYKDTNPNKLFEYMMLGIPFIASDFKNWVDLIASEEAGIFLDSRNVTDKVVDNIISIFSNTTVYYNMAHNGIRFISECYNWKIIDEPTLISIYNKVVRK